ncbi:MAG: tRNA (N6-threonylcarbamoyladenosine(37)-N6)-methyltransferase TrmO [Clostridiales bacterium]|nr:tRNA (N6-threonylcarbamoyladenosine(37)-N6)-methyltransferase TrmO [Clostridiales bacterium]
MKAIGHIYTDLPEKFGVPRQSGLAPSLFGKIVFEPEYRVKDAVRGLEGFSHIWLLWEFSEAKEVKGDKWQPTVRPPRLGGNKRMGVFATRSPFRPNNIGLSAVKIEKIDTECENAPVIFVSGVDMMNGTPLFDIKPYLPAADCIPEASGGFTEVNEFHVLAVSFPENLLKKLPEKKRAGAIELLSLDPRPAYIKDTERIFGIAYADCNIKFTVEGDALIVTEVEQT